MAISAISGFSPAISLINSLSSLNRVSLLTPTTGLSGLLALASTQSTISDVGRLLNNVETLQAAATALTVPGLFAARTASAANARIATATASSATPNGSFALQVSQLAQAQTVTTAAQASSLTPIGSGQPATLTFTFAGGTSRTLTLGAADGTLSGVAAAINAADIGVEARLVSTGGGVALALTGQTGAGNAFTLGVSGDAALADVLAFPPGGGSGPTLTSAAQDAQGTVSGIAFSASTNQVNTGVAGLSLNLLATGTTTLTVSANTGAADAVQRFVDAFNEVRSEFTTLASGSLSFGLSAALLGAQLSGTVNAAGTVALARIGIASTADGSLSFNEAAFQTALGANPASVAAVFANGGTGVAEQVAAAAAGPLSPAELLPTLAPALTFPATLGASSQDSLLLSLFGQDATTAGRLSSALASQFLLAGLIGGSSTSSAQTATTLVDLMLAEVLFANTL